MGANVPFPEHPAGITEKPSYITSPSTAAPSAAWLDRGNTPSPGPLAPKELFAPSAPGLSISRGVEDNADGFSRGAPTGPATNLPNPPSMGVLGGPSIHELWSRL